MPHRRDEISWGFRRAMIRQLLFLTGHTISGGGSHDATVVAQGDSSPYLAVKKFGKGYFIYIAGFQPLIGHGGCAGHVCLC